MIHCAACGYPRDTHDPDGRCHPATGDKNGRRGKWREPPPVDYSTWEVIIARDARARFAAIEEARKPYEPPVILPPQVVARAPHNAGEVAGYQGRQAVGLGRKARGLGWTVTAEYSRAGDGTEGSYLKLAKGPLRAVATWLRKPGNIGRMSGWSADVAFAWRSDVERFPVRINHTDLEDLIE